MASFLLLWQWKTCDSSQWFSEAREEKQLTQTELGNVVDKKREYISRIENKGSNFTLKTLYDIVEKGLGGKVKIQIEL